MISFKGVARSSSVASRSRSSCCSVGNQVLSQSLDWVEANVLVGHSYPASSANCWNPDLGEPSCPLRII